MTKVPGTEAEAYWRCKWHDSGIEAHVESPLCGLTSISWPPSVGPEGFSQDGRSAPWQSAARVPGLGWEVVGLGFVHQEERGILRL